MIHSEKKNIYIYFYSFQLYEALRTIFFTRLRHARPKIANRCCTITK